MKISSAYFIAAAILATSAYAAEDEKPKPGPLDKDEDKKGPKGSSGGNSTDVSSLEKSGASEVGTYVAMGAIGVSAVVGLF